MGPSGSQAKYDGLCMMPWNPIRQRFYVFIWSWLIILLVLTVFNLVYRLADIFLPVLRRFRLRRLQSSSSNSLKTWNSPTHILVKRLSFGDYFLVYMLGNNMNSYFFAFFVEELSQLLTSTEPRQQDKDKTRLITKTL